MGPNASVICDSLAPCGERLTTIAATYERYIHDEFLTHRALCLAGDSVLEFDLPVSVVGRRRKYTMRLDEFVDKWENGARRLGSKPKTDLPTDWINPEQEYPVPEIVAGLGLANGSNLNTSCRSGAMPARQDGRTWLIRGRDVLAWRASVPAENRYDMRARLAGMGIRQLNEDTGDIQLARVANAFRSGTKEVYEVSAGDYRVSGSLDHRVLTTQGWKVIGELTMADWVLVRRFGTPADERLDHDRLRKIDGRWRSSWQIEQRQRLIRADPQCRRCCSRAGVDIHHVEPVYVNTARAFDEENIVLLCENCHQLAHAKQGWQVGHNLYGAAVRVDDVARRGTTETYDLEIAGDYPNFLANGVVVHNSRNSRSSRAVPVAKMLEEVKKHPVVPIHWGAAQKGMQARDEVSPDLQERAQHEWLLGRDRAIETAEEMLALGLHKQVINYLLMPYTWITVVASATSWTNFFALRCHRDAHPSMQRIAGLMLRAYLASQPVPLAAGEMHLPYVLPSEKENFDHISLKAMATARCARVSLKPFDKDRADPEDDLRLYNGLKQGAGDGIGHWSPFEHTGTALAEPERSGNFRGFLQHRKEFIHEEIGALTSAIIHVGLDPGDYAGVLKRPAG
jgi:hypothetical protein